MGTELRRGEGLRRGVGTGDRREDLGDEGNGKMELRR
jgi:hypothetical protein